MRSITTTLCALLALGLLGAADEPEVAGFEPSARIVYESDTRAYYRPCG